MTESYEIVQAETVRLGTLQVQGPHEVVSQASIIAGELAHVINDRKLYSIINGKKYVRVEGWNTLGAMLGILPREVSVTETDDGDYEAVVELVRATDGEVIGRGSALLGSDEPSWAKRPRYARRSMAITRATGKAFRLGFSWIMALAGYEVTPAEEIIEGVVEEVKQPKAQSKDKPASKPMNGTRPYSPEIVRKKIHERAEKHEEFNPNDAQRNLLRYGLELCFLEDPQVDDKRHTVLNYLTGSTSTKDVDGQMFKAIVEDWLEMIKDTGGEYHINNLAAMEAKEIYGVALKEEGQQELDGIL